MAKKEELSIADIPGHLSVSHRCVAARVTPGADQSETPRLMTTFASRAEVAARSQRDGYVVHASFGRFDKVWFIA